MVASIGGGWTSAVLALERFGSASRADPVHKTGKTLGQWLRSLFLCDYFTVEEFRRELSRMLSHGESVHTLQRAIYFGSLAAARGRQLDELVAVSGSLTLLTNLVMAWMTHRMQTVLDQWTKEGHSISTVQLRHISPMHFEGINFRGTFHFPTDQYLSRLLPHAQKRLLASSPEKGG